MISDKLLKNVLKIETLPLFGYPGYTRKDPVFWSLKRVLSRALAYFLGLIVNTQPSSIEGSKILPAIAS